MIVEQMSMTFYFDSVLQINHLKFPNDPLFPSAIYYNYNILYFKLTPNEGEKNKGGFLV